MQWSSAQRKFVLALLAVATVAAVSCFWGIGIGLPSNQRLISTFGENYTNVPTSVLADAISHGVGERSEFMERDKIENYGELARLSVYFDAVRSYNPDEFHTFKVLSHLYSNRTILPESYAYGNFYFYQMAVPLGIAKILGLLKVMPPEQYLTQPDNFANFYLAGRIWLVLYAIGTAIFIFLTTWRLTKSLPASLAAGVLFAVLPIVALSGKTVKVDMVLAFWSSFTLYFAVRLSQKFRWRDFIWVGVGIGLSAGTKYPGALLALVPFVLILPYKFKYLKQLSVCAVVSLFTFIAVTPAVYLDFNLWWFDFCGLQSGIARTEPFALLVWDAVCQYTADNMVFSILLLIAFTQIKLIWRSPFLRSGVVFMLAVFLLTSQGQPNSESYLLPMLVMSAILIAAVTPKFIVWSGIFILFGFTLAYNQTACRENVRLTAANWINEHIPAGASIGMRRYPVSYRALMLDPEKYDLRNELEQTKADTLAADYYIDSSFEWDQTLFDERCRTNQRPSPTEQHQIIAQFEEIPYWYDLIPLTRNSYRINYFYEVVRPRFTIYKKQINL